MSCGAPGEVRAGGGLRLRTHGWPNPGAPRAVLLHSLAAHGHWWDWAAPYLAERFDLVGLDFRGHGGSDHGADTPYSFQDYAADVLAVLDSETGSPSLLIGHSMGGYMAAWVAAHHPGRVAGAVIIDILTDWPADFAEFARRQAERASPEFASPEAAGERFRLSPSDPTAAVERVRHLGESGVVERAPGRWTYAFARRVFLHPPVDPWPFLPRIACPALVMHGEHSELMDAPACRRVAGAMSHGTPLTLAGARHHLIVAEPERFSAAVLDWHRAMIAR